MSCLVRLPYAPQHGLISIHPLQYHEPLITNALSSSFHRLAMAFMACTFLVSICTESGDVGALETRPNECCIAGAGDASVSFSFSICMSIFFNTPGRAP